jgi:ribosomal protein L31E
LTVWDAKSNITYWQSIQEYLERQNISKQKKKNVRIDIPINNILNEEGIKQIANQTRSRYARFERERQGAQVLIRFFEQLGISITRYDPQDGVVHFWKPDDTLEIQIFGSRLHKIANSFDVIANALKRIADDNIFLQELVEIDQFILTIQEEREQLLETTKMLNDLFCEIRKTMENHAVGTSNDDLIVLHIPDASSLVHFVHSHF